MGMCLLAGSLHAAEVSVVIDDDVNGWTQQDAGAGSNLTKDNLVADDGVALWGVSNGADKNGMLYEDYTSIAGTELPATIQAGTYTLALRVGNGNVYDFTGLNDISSGVNTDMGAVAGFFATVGADAQASKNNMYTEFNGVSGVTYTPPTEADPTNSTWTTWTFSWEVADGSSVIGSNFYFGVYNRTGGTENYGAAFFDNSTLSYSSGGDLPVINDFSSDTDTVDTNGTLVTLSWDVSTDVTALAISPTIGNVLSQTVDGIGQTSVTVYATTTFILTASNADGSVTSDVIVSEPQPVVSVNVPIGDSGTQIDAGAVNTTKDGLDAEEGNLWGVSNTSTKDGLYYFTYSDLAGTNLSSTIQSGTYIFSARIGASSNDPFSGLNDITAGSNTEDGNVAGFFSTLSTDAETAKNSMVTEFNDLSGVNYYQPSEKDPDSESFTTWTFMWTVAEGSPVIGTDPYFGVYTKIGSSGGNGFWDDSTLSYSSSIGELPSIVDFVADTYEFESTGTVVTLSWEVSTNLTALTISSDIGNVLPVTVNGIGQTSVVVNAETTFTLTASNDVCAVSSDVTIQAPEMLINRFEADTYLVETNGTPVTLFWDVTNAYTVSISPDVGEVSSSGQTTVVVDAETTFTLTAMRDTQTLTSFVTISEPELLINDFSADTHMVDTNGTRVTLSWDVTNAYTVSISPDIGEVSLSGQTSLVVHAAQIYTLTATRGTQSSSEDWRFNLEANQPNILLMLVDDYGPMDSSVLFAYDSYTDSGTPLHTAFNDYYHTPNMETLAANGMKFTQAYAMPMCSPTRVSLMTGFNTARHGVTHHLNVYETVDNASFDIKTHRGPNNWRWLGMDGTDVALPQLLKDAGYYTFQVGKDHTSHVQDMTAIGFDVIDSDLYKATVLTPKAETMIEDAVESGEPFFGFICYRDVHTSFYYASDYTNDYSAAYSDNHAKFGTMVESVDNSLGTILAKLEEEGVAENTLIIFLGDNGSDSPALSDEGEAYGDDFDDYPMRGKKGSTYEGGIRVPLLAAWASPNSSNSFQQALSIPGDSVEHDMVTVEDIAPTILSTVGAAIPDMDGYDLTPYLRAEDGTHRPQKVLRHMPHEHRSNYFTCFRDGDWKIIYRYHIEESIANGETHEDAGYNSFELYNLADDPRETNDLASVQTEKMLTMARAMAQELDESWGDYGELWPTLNPERIAIPDRPLEDDPFFIDFSLDGRDEIDSDGDGLSDAEEDLNADGLVAATETDADDLDTDGDGSDDYTEHRLNLDPLDAEEAFVVEMIVTGDSSFSLSWPSTEGTSYNILTSTNLLEGAESWQVAVSNVSAHAVSNETSQVVDEEGLGVGFFRVELLP
jgi:arylsulfatase A-like enzyme